MLFRSTPLAPAMPHVKTGKLKALATTGPKRVRITPDLPTVAEAGVPGFEVENWQGIVVPARTPRAIVDKLNGEIKQLLGQWEMTSALNAQGLDAAAGTPQSFDQFIRAEIDKWRKVVQAANIKVE